MIDISAYKRLFALLDQREKRLYLLAILVMSINAVLEMASIVSVLPFLTAITQPEHIHEQALLAAAYDLLGCESDKEFLLYAGGVLTIFLMVSSLSNTLFIWFSNKYCWWLNERISHRFNLRLLKKPYLALSKENSANIQSALYFDITEVIRSGFIPITRILARGLCAVLVLLALLITNPRLALIAFLAVGLLYITIFRLVRFRLNRCGQGLTEGYAARIKVAAESLTGIKLNQLMHLEPYFLERYDQVNGVYSRYRASAMTLGQAPRYLVEGGAFTMVMLVALFQIYRDADLMQSIPTLGFFALSG